MTIGGVSIILILGILNLVLVAFQISSGLRWIRVPFGVHRRSGITLFLSAVIHAFLAILIS
ncbi:MAG: hypothetical protein A2170_17140 [Deltaproteobacteria bacterium RBG_13_53_10]|nr:MAG: hypothetical protein A2170_17140 [Deltaproteobacteria bacterium RBG_13_53_10]